jgi:hypothetical protein
MAWVLFGDGKELLCLETGTHITADRTGMATWWGPTAELGHSLDLPFADVLQFLRDKQAVIEKTAGRGRSRVRPSPLYGAH